MASNIPTSLVRSLSIPDEKSLVLLTSVLGATSNWIICRFLSNYLRSNVSLVDTHISSGVGVIFLSFLRSYDFWRDGTTRLGLDLDHRRRDGQFVYLDGLDGQISAFHRTPESHAAQDDNPLGSLEQRLNVAINAMRESDPTNQRSIVLMVDQIDLALALSGGLITSVDVLNMISRLRQVGWPSCRSNPLHCIR
jgi:elongator complex protein 6